jgi:hypothetical protein
VLISQRYRRNTHSKYSTIPNNVVSLPRIHNFDRDSGKTFPSQTICRRPHRKNVLCIIVIMMLSEK